MQLSSRTINLNSKITLHRTLPVQGEVLVHPGRKVNALNVIARAEMPSRYRVINVARQLAKPDVDMDEVLLVAEGDFVEANKVMAMRKENLSFLQRKVRAPAEGYIAKIGPGWVILETDRTIIEVQAFINGVINRVVRNRGVIIETTGALIEAACGFGGEAHGQLIRRVDSPYEALETNAIDETVSEAIIFGGRTVDEETLRKAEQWQVRGLVVGSIQASLLNLNPPVKVRVVATEGFGDIAMSPHTFSILTSLSQKEVSIRGQTPNLIRRTDRQWVEERPIIVATNLPKLGRNSSTVNSQEQSETVTGAKIRITRGPLLGLYGTIDLIPAKPQATAAGIIAPGVNVKVNNEVHYVPWANLEQVD